MLTDLPTVELQPYGLATLRQECPCLCAKIKKQSLPTVLLLTKSADGITILVCDSATTFRMVTFSCPSKLHDLFVRPCGERVADKIVRLLQDSYDSWLQTVGLQHPLQYWHDETPPDRKVKPHAKSKKER